MYQLYRRKMSDSEKVQTALRVSQLDALELDTALFDLLKGQLTSAFKYFSSSWLTSYGPEVNASLRCILLKFSIHMCESTIGQQLLDLRYKNTFNKSANVSPATWMTPKQKLLYAFLTIGGPWLSERADTFAAKTSHIPHADKFWTLLEKCQSLWKILSLINFLFFLSGGRYQILSERILGIQAMFPRPQGVRQVGFEFMERELLWHGFAEFLFFVLPLINFRRIKNTFSQFFVRSKEGENVMRSEEYLRCCVVCEDWPCNPMQIGCPHVFCYYCVYANLKADPSYRCPGCGMQVMDVEPVILHALHTKSPTEST